MKAVLLKIIQIITMKNFKPWLRLMYTFILAGLMVWLIFGDQTCQTPVGKFESKAVKIK